MSIDPTVEELADSRDDRAALLAELHKTDITRIKAEYNGSGDSGDFDDVQFYVGDNEVKVPPKLHNRVITLLEQYLYDAYAGWENNEGGGGEFVWDIATDVILHDHYYNVLTTENQETHKL